MAVVRPQWKIAEVGSAGKVLLIVVVTAVAKLEFVHAKMLRRDLVAVGKLELARFLDEVRLRTNRLLVVWLVLCFSSVTSKAEAADVAAFLADYNRVVKQRVARQTSLEVEGVLVEVRAQNLEVAPANRTVRELIYICNPTHEKLQSHFTERPNAVQLLHEVSVVVQGARRNFWLKKSDPNGGFAITMMGSPTAALRDIISRERAFLINVWSHLGTYSVAKLLDSPGFRVERVEPEGDLIGVDFSFRPEDPKKQLMAGHFVVDPAQGMAIRRQEVRRWSATTPDRIGTVRGEATYRMVDGIALPDEVDLRIGTPTNPDKDHLHFRATRVSVAPVPDSAFSLAAFGLGDVERPAPRSRFDFAYWAVGLAGVAFALSLFLKWRGRNLARAGDRAAGVAG